jgi:hypothetical protein
VLACFSIRFENSFPIVLSFVFPENTSMSAGNLFLGFLALTSNGNSSITRQIAKTLTGLSRQYADFHPLTGKRLVNCYVELKL